MKKSIKLIITILAILSYLFLFSCDETTEFESSQLFDPSVHGKLAEDTLYAELDTTFSISDPITQAANRLLTGSFASITCKPVIRFIVLPTNAFISEAYIRFTAAGVTGDIQQPFMVEANPILNEWTTNRDTINFDPATVLGTMELPADSSDTLIMQMNSTGLDFLNMWADEDSSEFNYGFILNFSNANFINSLYSNRSTLGPWITMTYTLPEDTTVHKDSVLATIDGFIIDGDIPRSANRNYVATLSPRVTLLQFDTSPLLNKFPEGVIIESANLRLSIDKSNTLFNDDFGVNLRILRLTSDLNDNAVVVDSSVLSSPTFSIDVTQLVNDSTVVTTRPGSERSDFGRIFLQDRVESPNPTKKLYVGFQNNIDFLSYIAFIKRDSPDKDKRPQIIVQYWIPPDLRF